MSNAVTPDAARDAFRLAVRKAQKSWKTRYYLWRVRGMIQEAARQGARHCGIYDVFDTIFLDDVTAAAIALQLQRDGFDATIGDIAVIWIEWGNDDD